MSSYGIVSKDVVRAVQKKLKQEDNLDIHEDTITNIGIGMHLNRIDITEGGLYLNCIIDGIDSLLKFDSRVRNFEFGINQEFESWKEGYKSNEELLDLLEDANLDTRSLSSQIVPTKYRYDIEEAENTNLILDEYQYTKLIEITKDFDYLLKIFNVDFISVRRNKVFQYLHITSDKNFDFVAENGIINKGIKFVGDLGQGIYVVDWDDIVARRNLYNLFKMRKCEKYLFCFGRYSGNYVECVSRSDHKGYIVIDTPSLYPTMVVSKSLEELKG